MVSGLLRFMAGDAKKEAAKGGFSVRELAIRYGISHQHAGELVRVAVTDGLLVFAGRRRDGRENRSDTEPADKRRGRAETADSTLPCQNLRQDLLRDVPGDRDLYRCQCPCKRAGV